MTEQAYLVLLSLSAEPRHGYAVIQAVRELSDGRTRLGAGTLYGNLDRLVAAGLVVSTGEEVVDGRLRRYYRATDDGRRAARAETLRLAELAERARRSLERHGPAGTADGLAGSGA
ncbi:DNA-binding PadR family transcriptional regulator [Cellulosimicrobium cellulans]|uniref:PadR family transcriptional regulator n=1 Tax=Cellulosimicrobium cellulans TaxID=1710 RepID=UPI0019561CC9|nr:PadR family transcriptional regulator [Cellulosimicrobium cellulans]MBM7818439.1 DNA-binding PadR family transcriptional regulator [Cellulosimicrobium cellulans]